MLLIDEWASNLVWETGRRRPPADIALALADFLRGDPTVLRPASIEGVYVPGRGVFDHLIQ
jgi:hypothetical protein